MPPSTASITAVWLFGVGPGAYFDLATFSFHVPTKAGFAAVWAITTALRASNNTDAMIKVRFIDFPPRLFPHEVRGVFVFTNVFDQLCIRHQVEPCFHSPGPRVRLEIINRNFDFEMTEIAPRKFLRNAHRFCLRVAL